MSTKTMKQRIALVAASALTAGFLSVVSAPVANAAAADFDGVNATGVCVALKADGVTAATLAADSGTIADQASFVTIAVGGTVTVSQDTTRNSTVRLSGTNGIFTAVSGTTSTIGTGDRLSQVTVNDDNVITASFNAVGSNKITLYSDAALTTAEDTVTITVVQSCVTGGFSVNNSFIENQVLGAISVADDNVDDVPGWTNGQTAQIALRIKNSYNADVPVGTWIVSATNGGLVGISSGSNTTVVSAGSTSTASVNGTGADIKVGIAQGTENAPLVSTVTVSYGSIVVLTKTIAITGDVSRIAVTSVETGKIGVQNFRTFKASAYDSAGNRVAVNPSADAATLDQNVTAADIGTTSATGDVQNSNFHTCGATAKGTTNVVFQVTAASGATIKSAPVALKCANTTRTYTASLDKASYVPGDIATLTITAKDVDGNAVHDSYQTADAQTSDNAFNYVNGSNVIPSIAGSQMTPVAALAAADEFAGGVKTYQFIVGATEGDYQMAVNLTGVTTDTAKAVKYSVKAGTATVSNADVLKSIVALIASINKQIQALQKLILARR